MISFSFDCAGISVLGVGVTDPGASTLESGQPLIIVVGVLARLGISGAATRLEITPRRVARNRTSRFSSLLQPDKATPVKHDTPLPTLLTELSTEQAGKIIRQIFFFSSFFCSPIWLRGYRGDQGEKRIYLLCFSFVPSSSFLFVVDRCGSWRVFWVDYLFFLLVLMN